MLFSKWTIITRFKWHNFSKRNERLLCQNLQPLFTHMSQLPMPQVRHKIFLSCTNNIPTTSFQPFNIRLWNTTTCIVSHRDQHIFNCQDSSGILIFCLIFIFLIFLFTFPSLVVSSYVTYFVIIKTLEFSFRF